MTGDTATAAALWVGRIGAASLAALTLLALVPHGHWVFRICDFPRVQILVLACGLAVFTTALLLSPMGTAEHAWHLAVLLAVASYQGVRVLPYTEFWQEEVPRTDRAGVTLLVCNLDVRNNERRATADMITANDPDILLLIECDDAWRSALADVAERYAHRGGVTRDEGLGIVLWSKLPLENTRTEHLVSERRASVHTAVRTGDGRAFNLVALHPTPPALPVRHEDERYSSDIRDAELGVVAEQIHDRRDEPWVVAGDFNDVAWSATTRLFQRVSGLLDPRIGRSLMNTYHAEYPLLRYPLDHVFVSGSFSVRTFERVRTPGSDHFAVFVELTLSTGGDADEPAPEPGDHEDTRENIEDGREAAAEHDERADDPPRSPGR